MAITIPSGFNITVQEAVDKRLLLTKAEMVAMADAKMPDKYLAVCSDDGKLYLYNKANTASSTTGKFRVFEGGGEPAEYLKSAAVSGNKLTLTKNDNTTVVFEPQGGQTYTAGENIQINNNVISATDTKYTAGTNVQISAQNVISATDTVYDDTQVRDLIAQEASERNAADYTLQTNINKKQDKLTAGTNITIDDNNVISATGGGATYTAGTNINITDNKISVATDDIELTGTSGTFTDEQMQKLSDSSLTCLILNNKRFKLQYTAVGRSGIVAMYTSTIESVSEVIEVDVTGKAWAHAETLLQKSLTAGDNVSISNNVISAIDTKLATQITLGQAITAQSAIGGIPAGKVYAATDTLATLLTDLLGGEAPSGDGKIYYSTGSTVPTSVTGMTSVAVQKDTLLASGYTWKNITLNNEYAFLAIDKSIGLTCYEIKQNGFALGYETVDLGTQWLYYPSAKSTDTGIRLVYSFEE